MWLIQLAVMGAVVLDLRVLGEPQGLPDYMQCAHTFYEKFSLKLNEGLEKVDGQIQDVAEKVEQVCGGGTEQEAVSQQRQQVMGTMSPLITLLGKMEAMEDKLNQMQGRLSLLYNLQQLPTKEDLNALTATITNILTSSLSSVANREQDNTTREEMTRVIAESLHPVLDAINETRRECASDARLSEVLQEVVEVKEDVMQVTRETVETKLEAKKCTDQGASQLGEVKAVVVALQEKLQGVDFDDQFANLDEMMEEIVNYTRLPPPPPPTLPPPPPPPPTTTTTTTTTTPRQIYPCEDSTFQGTSTKSFQIRTNVCETAARFKKCHLEAVAFHCCHTCTSLNLLPAMGPWRYVNKPRVVNTLDILRFFTL